MKKSWCDWVNKEKENLPNSECKLSDRPRIKIEWEKKSEWIVEYKSQGRANDHRSTGEGPKDSHNGKELKNQ